MTAPAIELRLADDQLERLADMLLARVLPLLEQATPAPTIRYLTVAEYAAERRCAIGLVYRAIEAGVLDIRKNGRKIAIPSTELDKDIQDVAA